MDIKYYINRGFHKLIKGNMIRNTKLDTKARLGYDIQLINSEIGKYSYIGEHSYVLDSYIGAFCSIADNCIIGGPSHAMEFVSTSPVFVKGKNIFGEHLAENEYEEYKRTLICNDVWMGSGCLVKAGVTIETGAVIGMGSVVTHNVGPYEVWAGNPARLIKKRFPDELSERLLKTKWWEADDAKLCKFGPFTNNPLKFCEEVEKNNGEI